MNRRKRSIPLQLYVSEEEYQLLQRRIKAAGTQSFASFAREMLLNGYLIKPDWENLKVMRRQLTGIGTNINQIAYRVNATHSIYRTDMEEMKEMFAKLEIMFRYNLQVMKKLDNSLNESWEIP